jgi:hypothetical protein
MTRCPPDTLSSNFARAPRANIGRTTTRPQSDPMGDELDLHGAGPENLRLELGNLILNEKGHPLGDLSSCAERAPEKRQKPSTPQKQHGFAMCREGERPREPWSGRSSHAGKAVEPFQRRGYIGFSRQPPAPGSRSPSLSSLTRTISRTPRPVSFLLHHFMRWVLSTLNSQLSTTLPLSRASPERRFRGRVRRTKYEYEACLGASHFELSLSNRLSTLNPQLSTTLPLCRASHSRRFRGRVRRTKYEYEACLSFHRALLALARNGPRCQFTDSPTAGE